MLPGGDPSARGPFSQYGQTPGSAGFPLGTLGAQGGMPGVRGGLPISSAPQQVQGRFAAQALQSNLAQLGQFQARQGALASAGLTNGVLAGNAAAAAAAANNVVRRDALTAAGIISPNHQGPLPNDLRAMRAPGGGVDRGGAAVAAAAAAAAAASGAPHGNLHSVVSQPGLQGYTQSSLAAALGGQQAAMNYPGAASRLNGSSMQQLQNTGRLGSGLGGNAAVNQLLHQGMPGTSAAPPTSIAPSQDLLSLLSRQKQGGMAVSGGLPTASAGLSTSASDPYAALRKAAAPPGVDGFSILNEEFPALPGTSGRTEDGGASGFGGARAAAAPAGLQQQQGQQQQPQPTTARGGFALMPAVSGADAAYGGGTGGGDAAMRAQAAAAASLSGMDYEQLLRFQQVQAAAVASQGSTAAVGAAQHQLPILGVSDPRGVRGTGGTAAATAVAAATGLVLNSSSDVGRLGLGQIEGGATGGEAGGSSGASGAAGARSPAGPLQNEEGRRGLGLPNRFGLLGLMPLLKMCDADLTMLSLGTDLTSLGLNLNSSESLHKALISPLAEMPVKSPEPEFELPACYKHIPQRLQPGYLTKFKEETLFYIFYSMPGDEAQLIAADELHCRGWMYHKRLRMWMLPLPNSLPQKSARGERGSFVVFNHSIWEAEQKLDLEILYDDLEKPPRLVRTKTVQQQQQQQQQGPLLMQHVGLPAGSGGFPPGLQPTPVAP